MSHVVVEQTYETPVTPAVYSGLSERLDPCFERYGVRWIASYISLDGLRMICHFDAADAEAVRAAYRSAGSRFDRVWTADVRL